MLLKGKGADHEGVSGVVRMETQTEVKNEGGQVTVSDEEIRVEGADAVILYISAATNFVNYKDVSGNAHKRATAYLNNAHKKPYEQAYKEHIAYYQEQFNRVKLDLGTSEEAKQETHLRVKHFNEGKDISLATLLFNMDAICLFPLPNQGDNRLICREFGIIACWLLGMGSIQ